MFNTLHSLNRTIKFVPLVKALEENEIQSRICTMAYGRAENDDVYHILTVAKLLHTIMALADKSNACRVWFTDKNGKPCSTGSDVLETLAHYTDSHYSCDRVYVIEYHDYIEKDISGFAFADNREELITLLTEEASMHENFKKTNIINNADGEIQFHTTLQYGDGTEDFIRDIFTIYGYFTVIE